MPEKQHDRVAFFLNRAFGILRDEFRINLRRIVFKIMDSVLSKVEYELIPVTQRATLVLRNQSSFCHHLRTFILDTPQPIGMVFHISSTVCVTDGADTSHEPSIVECKE